jgi:anti-anti-sigma factor
LPLKIAIREEEGGDIRLVVEGEVTLKTFRQLCDAADGCIEHDPKPGRVWIDFAGVDYVDSLGLGSFIKIFTSFKKAEIDMAMANLAPAVLESLRMTKLDQILPIV